MTLNTPQMIWSAYQRQAFSLVLRRNVRSKEAVEEQEVYIFFDRELEVMIDQSDRRKRVLFGGFSSGFNNKTDNVKRQNVTEAVSASSSEPQILEELIKKWLILSKKPRDASMHTECASYCRRTEDPCTLPAQ